MNAKGIEGKIAFITGAAQGIGEAVARTLASQGAHIAAVDYNPEKLEKVVSSLKAEGRHAEASFEDVKAFPRYESKNDIHCVTGWSRLDNVWQGVRACDIAEKAGVKEEAGYVILHAEEGWTTNLPLDDFLAETSLLAYAHNGEPLTPEHGFPLRGVFPHLYFWKSAKWLRGIQFTKENHPGFWERNGYHMRGDPWQNQRFTWD